MISALTVCCCFFRFGLSNKFDTEFPSVLTGKVQFSFSFMPFSQCLSVQFQVGRIKQLKPQWFYCSFGSLTTLTSQKPPHSTLVEWFWSDSDAFKVTHHSASKVAECVAVQPCKWVSRPWGSVGGDPSVVEGPALGDKIMKWRLRHRQERKASWVGRWNTKRLQG